MYDNAPLYAGWESTANFRDTGEAGGLLTSRNPDQARKELEQLSEVFPGLREGESEDEGPDDEGGGPRHVPAERWGTLDGLTPFPKVSTLAWRESKEDHSRNMR